MCVFFARVSSLFQMFEVIGDSLLAFGFLIGVLNLDLIRITPDIQLGRLSLSAGFKMKNHPKSIEQHQKPRATH